MPRPKLPLSILVAVFHVLLSFPAFAERVLLVEPKKDDGILYEAFGRLRAELELDGFEVVLSHELDEGSAPDAIEAQAARHGAFAAIALARSPNGTSANICIVDRVTGKTSLQSLAIPQAKDAPTLLAVRAVDLLRASLRELGEGEKPPPQVLGVRETAPPPEVARFAEKRVRFQLRAGATVLFGPALGAAFGPSLGLDYRAFERLTVGVWLNGPTFGAAHASNQGVARARQEMATLRGFVNLLKPRSSTRLEFGPLLGVGLYHLEATSEVEPSLASQTEDMFALAAHGGLGAQIFIGSSVSLGADASALFLVPRPVVAISDSLSSPASPLFLGSLALSVAF